MRMDIMTPANAHQILHKQQQQQQQQQPLQQQELQRQPLKVSTTGPVFSKLKLVYAQEQFYFQAYGPCQIHKNIYCKIPVHVSLW